MQYNVMYLRTSAASEGKNNYVSVLYKFYSKQQVVLYSYRQAIGSHHQIKVSRIPHTNHTRERKPVNLCGEIFDDITIRPAMPCYYYSQPQLPPVQTAHTICVN